MKPSQRILYIAGFVILVIAIIVGISYARNKAANSTTYSSSDPGQPLATDTLNKSFAFSVHDASGKEVGKLTYTLQDAELRDQILIKGQPAISVKGKTFLIVNLKIDNKTDKTIQINTRDYLRLSVDNGKTWLAPDIHNDPVEVQAISTKFTRLGFAINSSDVNNSKLQIGEIKGKKSYITLHF